MLKVLPERTLKSECKTAYVQLCTSRYSLSGFCDVLASTLVSITTIQALVLDSDKVSKSLVDTTSLVTPSLVCHRPDILSGILIINPTLGENDPHPDSDPLDQ